MPREKGGRPSRHGGLSRGSTATAGKRIAAGSIRHSSRRDICATLASVSARLRSTSVTTEQGRASAAHRTPAIGVVFRMIPDDAT